MKGMVQDPRKTDPSSGMTQQKALSFILPREGKSAQCTCSAVCMYALINAHNM